MESRFSHVDERGEIKMVDVSGKVVSQRVAEAAGKVFLRAGTLRLIQENKVAKGDVISTAKLAGIMAAKKTAELIPLCHPLPITYVDLEITADGDNSEINIKAVVKTAERTGVEMEALVAVSAAALTIYDMAKAVDKDMVIGEIKLVRKSGGKSGDYIRKG